MVTNEQFPPVIINAFQQIVFGDAGPSGLAGWAHQMSETFMRPLLKNILLRYRSFSQLLASYNKPTFYKLGVLSGFSSGKQEESVSSSESFFYKYLSPISNEELGAIKSILVMFANSAKRQSE